MSPVRGMVRATDYSVAHPYRVLGVALALAVLGLGLAAGLLELRTSNLDLIDESLPPVRRFLDFSNRFGTPNMLVLVFADADAEQLALAVDRAAPLLRQAPGVRGVLDRKPVAAGTLAVAAVNPYFRSFDSSLYFVFVQPADSRLRADRLTPFIAGVDAAVAAAGVDALGVSVGLTGLPKYAVDDKEVIQRDIARLSLLALGLIVLIFLLSFRSLARPLLAAVALVAAVLWTLGLVSLYPGHLTLLSAFFASILFGIGIDFGIHLVGRIEELRSGSTDPVHYLPQAVADLARGLWTSAATTATVFLAMQLSGFKGFAELGLVAGVGVLLCLVSMVTVFPALLVVVGPDNKLDQPTVAAVPSGSGSLHRLLTGLQRPWLAVMLALAAIAGALVTSPAFDGDYLELQPADSEAVRLERRMVEESDYSPQFAAFTAANEQRARALVTSLHASEVVGAVRSALTVDLQAALAEEDASASSLFRQMLIEPEGRLAVYAYPLDDVWGAASQARFLQAMQALDPEVTGMPFLGSFMIERSKHALEVTAALAFCLLAFWLWLDFRRLSWTLLAAAPTVLALGATLGLMRLLGMTFNPLNVMALPVILGLAIDDGVHMVHRLRAEHGDLERCLRGTGRTITVTTATTVAAFGVLALTSHRGLASFATLLAMGVASAWLSTIIVTPRLARWLASDSGGRRKRHGMTDNRGERDNAGRIP